MDGRGARFRRNRLALVGLVLVVVLALARLLARRGWRPPIPRSRA